MSELGRAIVAALLLATIATIAVCAVVGWLVNRPTDSTRISWRLATWCAVVAFFFLGAVLNRLRHNSWWWVLSDVFLATVAFNSAQRAYRLLEAYRKVERALRR